MRKYLGIFLAFVLSISTAYGTGVTDTAKKQAQTADGQYYKCNQSFEAKKLRIDKESYYYFNDTFRNDSNYSLKLYGIRIGVALTNSGYFGGLGIKAEQDPYPVKLSSNELDKIFDRSNGVIKAKTEVKPGQSIKVIDFTQPFYPVKVYSGLTRNDTILYLVYYIKSGKTEADATWHTECQPYTATWCGDGVRDNYKDPTGKQITETCDPADPKKEGWGNGGCNEYCEPIVVKNPTCDSLKATQTTGTGNLNTTLVCTGTDTTNFKIEVKDSTGKVVSTVNSSKLNVNLTNAGNYTAVCYAEGKTSNACKVPLKVEKFKPELQIKKYAKGNDAQTSNNAVSVQIGEEYPYTFEVKNIGKADITGAEVTDPFPAEIEVVKTGTGNGWTCTQSGQEMRCKYAGTIKAGATAPTITAIAKLRNTAEGKAVKNVAVVCGIEDPKYNPETGKCEICEVGDPEYNPETKKCEPRDPCKPGDPNYNPETGKCDPVVVATPKLTIKKYVKEEDAQTAKTAVSVQVGEEYLYTFVVKNTGEGDSNGARVEDTLPSDIEVVKTGTGTGWSCTQSGQKMTCLYSGVIKAGATAPTITLTAKLKESGDGKVIRNVAAVCYPNDSNCDEEKEECKPGDINYDPTSETCDPATVETKQKCLNLDVTPNTTPVVNQEVTLKCEGTKGVKTYKIKVLDVDANKVIKEINSKNGTYTFTAKGNYLVSCYVDNKTTTENECVVPVKPQEKPTIKVDKTDKNPADKDGKQENDTQTIDKKAGTDAVFKITVTNNGTEDLKDIYLTDAKTIGSEVDALDCNRTTSETKAILKTIGNKDEIFNIGESFTYECKRPNETNDKFPYTNKIRVDGVGVKTGIKVTDDDDTKVKTEECQSIVAPKSGTSSTSSITDTITCNTDWADNQIVILKGNTEIERIDGKTTSYTFRNVGSYDVKCVKKGFSIDYNNKDCKATYRIGGNPPESGCSTLTPSSANTPGTVNFTCDTTRSNSDTVIVIKDSNGNVVKTIEGKTGSYSFAIGNYTAKCYSKTYGESYRICTGDYTPSSELNYCGDGKVQNPPYVNPPYKIETLNRKAREVCDLGSYDPSRPNKPYNGDGKSGCTKDCQIDFEADTTPGEWYFEYLPHGTLIVGEKSNVFKIYNDSKYLPRFRNSNKVEGEVFVKELCVTTDSSKAYKRIKNGNPSLEKTTICEPVGTEGRVIGVGGQEYVFNTKINELKDKIMTKKLSSGVNYEDNVIVVYFKTEDSDGDKLANSLWSSMDKFKVRVAKSSIVSTGGGVNYVAVGGDVSKIEERVNIVRNYEGNDTVTAKDNKNLIGLSLINALNSYAINASMSSNAQNQQDKFTNGNGTKATGAPKTDLNEFKEYKGVTGAWILENQNFKLSDCTDLKTRVDKPTTYIVQNGDLTITCDIEDINYNIAFVVRGGDIKIGKNVKELNGTYIAVPFTEGGKFKSYSDNNDTYSDIQLVVNGSLYGNIEDLVSKRTYMKLNEKGQLDVGTVVSFGSSAFRKPAPLISTFTDEYMQATKVAK